MQNRTVKTTAFSRLRIDVQRIAIAAQAVKCGLIFGYFTGKTKIRLESLRWCYRFCLGSGITTKSTGM